MGRNNFGNSAPPPHASWACWVSPQPSKVYHSLTLNTPRCSRLLLLRHSCCLCSKFRLSGGTVLPAFFTCHLSSYSCGSQAVVRKTTHNPPPLPRQWWPHSCSSTPAESLTCAPCKTSKGRSYKAAGKGCHVGPPASRWRLSTSPPTPSVATMQKALKWNLVFPSQIGLCQAVVDGLLYSTEKLLRLALLFCKAVVHASLLSVSSSSSKPERVCVATPLFQLLTRQRRAQHWGTRISVLRGIPP